MSKPYGALTVPEKWDWHARVYAFRRVVLGVDAETRSSPCDEEGKWFDSALADEAERRLRNTRTARFVNQRGDDAVWEARDIANNWARDRGYRDFEHYQAVERIDHVEACKRLILSLPGPASIPRAAGGKLDNPHDVARLLGVKVREVSPEKWRADQIALGIELESHEAAE